MTLNVAREGKPLSPSAANHYDEQLKRLATQREQMRDVVARWWTLIEKGH
jgi:hypothetical protein